MVTTTQLLSEAEHLQALARLEKFLVDNFSTELVEGEFLTDAAIRIMQHMKNRLTVQTAADVVFGGRPVRIA